MKEALVSESDLKRLARSKAEFLKLYQWESGSVELREAVERIHLEAAKLGISIDDLDTEVMPLLEKSHFSFMTPYDQRHQLKN